MDGEGFILNRTAVDHPPPASGIFRPGSFCEPLDLDGLFAAAAPLELEIGCGNGSFLAAWAARNPDRNFLGLERLIGRLRKADNKGRRAQLTNLRLLRIEAAYGVRYLLPPGAVAVCHIYFPDPWPKKKHWKNRLVSPPFVQDLARALAAGGRVYLRTDDLAYHERIREVFAEAERFSPIPEPEETADLLTDFEREFRARGVETLRSQYRLD